MLVIGVATVSLLIAGGAQANGDAPTNQQLYKMIQDLQASQQRLKSEGARAKQAAYKAQRELILTRQELEVTKQELKSAQGTLGKTQDRLASTVRSTVKQELEAQAPQVTLGPSPMPPSGAGHGVFGSIEFGYTDFFGVDTPFAALRSTGGEIPFGAWHNVDVDREMSYRPEVGWYLPDGRGIVSADYFFASASGDAEFFPTGNVLNSNNQIVGPGNLGPFDNTTVRGAVAHNNVLVRQADLQYQFPIKLTKNFNLIPKFGVRYTKFRNRVSIDYFEANKVFGFNKTFRSVSWGVGPNIGLGSNWGLMKNLTLSVEAGGGVLFGRNRSKRTCQGVSDCVNPDRLTATNTDTRSFPFVSGNFSLRYDTNLKGLSATLGYRVESVFDLVTRQRDVAAFEPRQDVFEQRNLTYDSVNLGLKYIW